MPIRLGGVPTGVARPPTEAPNDVISIIPMANRAAAGDRAGAGPPPAAGSSSRSPEPTTCAAIARPIGYIIAVVATLLIQAEMKVVTAP